MGMLGLIICRGSMADYLLTRPSHPGYSYVQRWQEVLRWIQEVVAEIGSDVTAEQLSEYVHKTLKSGKVKEANLLRWI